MSRQGLGHAVLLPPAIAEGEDQAKHRTWKTLSPFARALLSTDGSFTLLLQAFANEAIEPVVLTQETGPAEEIGQALGLHAGEEMVRRSVLLRTAQTRRNLVYATSYIAFQRLPSEVRERLLEGHQPIGLILRSAQIESFRELVDWGSCRNSYLSVLNANFRESELLYRTYRIFTQHRPLIQVSEYFPRSLFEEYHHV